MACGEAGSTSLNSPASESGAKAITRQDSPPASPPPQRRDGRAALPVEVARATATQMSDDIAAIGTLLSDESVSIAPETSGRLAGINFKDGETVTEGAVLFTLDTELADALLADAKARLALAEANFGRSQQLQKSGTVARSTHDASVAELQVAQATVESVQLAIKKLTITAPFPGTLGFRNVSVGAYIAAGTDLVKLDKIDRLKVSFSLPELEQARIAIGQEVVVTADALPGENFAATISAIDPVDRREWQGPSGAGRTRQRSLETPAGLSCQDHRQGKRAQYGDGSRGGCRATRRQRVCLSRRQERSPPKRE